MGARSTSQRFVDIGAAVHQRKQHRLTVCLLLENSADIFAIPAECILRLVRTCKKGCSLHSLSTARTSNARPCWQFGEQRFTCRAMTDARKFNNEIVVPTLAEFDADFSCLRRAFLAVTVLDALAAQIYAQAVEHNINPFELLGWHRCGDPSDQNDSTFRHRIAGSCSGFEIVRDVAKANKHAILTRGNPMVNRSEQIVSQSKGYGLGRFGEGRSGGARQIIVKLDGGEEIYLEHQMLEAHDTLLNLIDLLERRLA